MALSAEDILTLVEITRQSRETVEADVEDIDAALETRLEARIALWDENKDSVDVELHGKVDMKAQRLLNAIRVRVCDLLGYPVPVSDEYGEMPGSAAVATSVSY